MVKDNAEWCGVGKVALLHIPWLESLGFVMVLGHGAVVKQKAWMREMVFGLGVAVPNRQGANSLGLQRKRETMAVI